MIFDGLAPQRRRLVVIGIAALLVVIIGAVIIAVVRALPRSEAVDQSVPGPVLLVPGYGGNRQSLSSLADALSAAGRDVTVVAPPGDGTGDLKEQADQLGKAADKALQASNATSVDVIGYSAGGVVARLWVRDGDGGSKARRVLTLGAPQHGTSQAALGRDLAGGCSVACTQLVPDSDLLRALNAGDETPAGPVWITIRSSSDQVVTPVDSAALDGALNIDVQSVCPRATTPHGGLPDDPVTRAALTSTLGVEAPTVPTDVNCQ